MGYPQPSRTKRTQGDYTLAFKLALVDRVEKGELTYGQAQDLYGIQGSSTVLNWLRKHGALDWSSHRGMLMTTSAETPEQKLKRLEQRVKDLEDINYLKDEMLNQLRPHLSLGMQTPEQVAQRKAGCLQQPALT